MLEAHICAGEDSGMERSETGRIEYIDALKGFAILCVVLGHAALSLHTSGMFPDAYGFLNGVYDVIYAFHMPLFMMISGYMYGKAYVPGGAPDKRRIRRRAADLGAVYALFSVLFLASKLAVNRFLPGVLPEPARLYDLLMLWARPYGEYWYIYALCLIYLLFSWKTLHQANGHVVLAALAVLAAAARLFTFPYFEVNNVLYYSFFFYVGCLYDRIGRKLIGSKALTAAAFCLAVALGALFWDRGPLIDRGLHSIPGVNVAVALGISLAVWYAFEHAAFIGGNRVLRYLGRHTLEIYLLSPFLMTVMGKAIALLGIGSVYIAWAFQTALCVAIPLLAAFVCQKLHIYDLFFKPVTFLREIRRRRVGAA